MQYEFIQKEYYSILNIINEFDKRLLTIKSWGVTLSLAALASGFQYSHFGLFLVASLSSISFWIIEGATKRHQMRYYLRMREIEVLSFENAGKEDKKFSTPRIDWSWSNAPQIYSGQKENPNLEPVLEGRMPYFLAWFFPHVSFPHIVSFLAGMILCYLGYMGVFSGMNW